MLERVTATWVVGLLGAHAGAAVAFGLSAVDLGEHADATWWAVLAVVVGQAAAATAGLLRVPRLGALTAVLAGAFAAAVLPVAYRPSPVPRGGWLLVLHVLPYAVVGVVLAGSAVAEGVHSSMNGSTESAGSGRANRKP